MIEAIQMEDFRPVGARIKVVGVGGGGGNAVNNMISSELGGVDFFVANTDIQVLNSSLAPIKVQLGTATTRGLGAGGNPQVGYNAAMEDQARIADAIGDADMVFITAGMGGGTGTGAAPVIAKIAREKGALTVAVVTKPFGFEGTPRRRRAEEGVRELAEHVDTLIVIPNDRLMQIADESTSLQAGFIIVDSVLANAVRGISDLITTPGLINVDFADVSTIMRSRGMALIGTGRAAGPDRAIAAARAAISSPLLEDTRIEGATGLLLNITGGDSLSVKEVHAAASLVQEAASDEADIIFGAVINRAMGDEVRVTVVATGFDRAAAARTRESTSERNALAWSGGAYVSTPYQPRAREAIPAPVEVPVAVRAPRTTAAFATLQMEAPEVVLPPVAAPVPPPVPVASVPVPPTFPPLVERFSQSNASADDFDQPAFLRRGGAPDYSVTGAGPSAANRPKPVQRNPFESQEASEYDVPAYMRK